MFAFIQYIILEYKIHDATHLSVGPNRWFIVFGKFSGMLTFILHALDKEFACSDPY